MPVLELNFEPKLQNRLDRYCAAIKSEADKYYCDLNKDIFSTELGIMIDRLTNSVKEANAERTNETLGEIRSYVNNHLYGTCFAGDKRYIDFYDSAWVGKTDLHVTLDELKYFIINEVFSAEKIGQDQATQAQNIFYPPPQPFPSWAKKLGLAAAGAALFTLGRCSKEDNHESRIEQQRIPSAEVQQR